MLAGEGRVDQVRRVLEQGANVNARMLGRTALTEAARHGHAGVVELLIARGEAAPEEARRADNKHLITRAMGLGELACDDVSSVASTLCRGQQLLLCSDGLCDVLSDVEIARIMAQEADLEVKLDRLVTGAVEAGGADNITAVLAAADDDAPEPASVTPLPAVAIARPDGYTAYFKPGE
jgi:protein phosphatase